jgi:hypothetical protein
MWFSMREDVNPFDAVVSSDASYNFGNNPFDLVLFSWSMPLVDVRKS